MLSIIVSHLLLRPAVFAALYFALIWAPTSPNQIPPKPQRSCLTDQQWADNFDTYGPRFVRDARLSSDGKIAVFAVRDSLASRLIAYDTDTGRILWDKEEGDPERVDIDSSSQEVAAVLAHNENCHRPTFRRFNLRTGEELRLEGLETNPTSNRDVYAMQYGEDGTLLIANVAGQTQIWDTATGRLKLDEWVELGLKPEQKYRSVSKPRSVWISGDNTKIVETWAVGVRLWAIVASPPTAAWTLKPLGYFAQVPYSTLDTDGPIVQSARLNANGTKVVVFSNQWINVYETSSHKLLKSFDPLKVVVGLSDKSGDLLIHDHGVVKSYSFATSKLTDILTSKVPQATIHPLNDGRVVGLSWPERGWEADYNQPATATLFDQKTGAILQHFRLPGRMEPLTPVQPTKSYNLPPKDQTPN